MKKLWAANEIFYLHLLLWKCSFPQSPDSDEQNRAIFHEKAKLPSEGKAHSHGCAFSGLLREIVESDVTCIGSICWTRNVRHPKHLGAGWVVERIRISGFYATRNGLWTHWEVNSK